MVRAWGTPAIVDLPGGQHELVASVEKKVLGFDPASGKRLWECTGVKDYICPSVVVHGDTVFVTGARSAVTMAIRAGGREDVSESHLLWSVNVGSLVPTPVYHDGRLYCVEQNGTALCLDAKTGKTVYRERIPVKGAGAKVYASTVLADGKLYAPTREDGTIVLAAGPKFEVLARNRLDDPSLFNATPAIAGSRILLRSNRCFIVLGSRDAPAVSPGLALYASTAFGWVFVMRHLKPATISVLYSVSMVLLLTAAPSRLCNAREKLH